MECCTAITLAGVDTASALVLLLCVLFLHVDNKRLEKGIFCAAQFTKNSRVQSW
jgi:hypothetical protein